MVWLIMKKFNSMFFSKCYIHYNYMKNYIDFLLNYDSISTEKIIEV